MMKPGDIRTFKKGSGNAAVLAVGVWAARQTKNGPIHIHITGTEKFHTTEFLARPGVAEGQTRGRNQTFLAPRPLEECFQR
jgi:hypothetical protein